jgi:hypothetical protein
MGYDINIVVQENKIKSSELSNTHSRYVREELDKCCSMKRVVDIQTDKASLFFLIGLFRDHNISCS